METGGNASKVVENGKLLLGYYLNPDRMEAQPVHETMTRQTYLTTKVYEKKKKKKACLIVRCVNRVPWEQSKP